MSIRPARWLAGVITAGAMAIGVIPASAQQFESGTADVSAPLSIEQRMQAMEEELIQLRKLSNTRFASMELETAEADGPKKDDAKKGDGSYEVGGVKVKKIDLMGKPEIALGGRVVVDNAWFHQSATNMAAFGDIQDGADFRAVRLSATGKVWENVDFKLEVDFADQGRPSFSDDDYINISQLPILQNIKIGRFKEPWSLDQRTSSLWVMFMERSLADAFSPGKTIGVEVNGYSEELDKTYAFGVFRTKTDNFGDGVADDRDTAFDARLTWLPYYDEPSNGRYLFHTGFGFSYRATLNSTASFSTAPEIRMQQDAAVPGDNGGFAKVPSFVSTGNISSNGFEEYNVETAWVNGPLSVQGELMLVDVQQITGVPANKNLFFGGGYVEASYFLTGENRNYNRQKAIFDRITPIENFFRVSTCDGPCCGKGAWEVAARWSHIDLDDKNIKGGKENNYTAGLNWYLNPNTKMMFNYIHADVDNSSKGANRFSSEDTLAVRAQLDF